MELWIAEKPNMGRLIAAALGGGQEDGGAIRIKGSDKVVTWSYGHLLESYMPHDYQPDWKSWKLEHLPIIPDRMLRKPGGDSRAQAQLRNIVKLVGQAKAIVVATDAAREGEAIAWSILDHAGWKGPAKRFWVSSQNPAAIVKATKALFDDAEKKYLYMEARIRSSTDWIWGVCWSRYYQLRACSYGDKVISVGRVQTATLAIIVDRDIEIENFRPSDYHELKAVFDLPVGRLELMHSPPKDKRIVDLAKAQAMAKACVGVPTTIRMDTKAKSLSPQPPYNMLELQATGNNRWGWSANKTLEVAQKLYEAGAITYPRTDSSHLNEDLKPGIPKHLAALRKHAAFKELADLKPTLRPGIFDSSKVTDHHGIIPTDDHVDVNRLGADAAKLFDVIARRFLAAMMPDAKAMATLIWAEINGLTFKTTGQIITSPGWKAAWGTAGEDAPVKKGEEQVTSLPPVKDGTRAAADPVEVVTRTTRPPDRFTEASLLRAMAAAGSKNADAAVREVLTDSGGIGTSATRDGVIEKLKFREFIRNDGKKIISTTRAREFVAVLRADRNALVDVEATAALELELRRIKEDPSIASRIWTRAVTELRAEVARLKKGPAPRKLSPNPKDSGPQKYVKPTGAPKRPAGKRGPATKSTGARKAAPARGKRKGTTRSAPKRVKSGS